MAAVVRVLVDACAVVKVTSVQVTPWQGLANTPEVYFGKSFASRRPVGVRLPPAEALIRRLENRLGSRDNYQ